MADDYPNGELGHPLAIIPWGRTRPPFRQREFDSRHPLHSVFPSFSELKSQLTKRDRATVPSLLRGVGRKSGQTRTSGLPFRAPMSMILKT